MKTILKRLFNTFTVLTTIGLIFSVFENEVKFGLIACGIFYALVLACNYILLGAVTLWHKSEDI
jgi:hypothetical protein